MHKRPHCTRCLRPKSTCICCWITATNNAVEVVVLQHPMEVSNPKGSARLLCLSLAHSTLAVGEKFSETDLQALITAPLSSQNGVPLMPKRTILLYPDTPADPNLPVAVPPPLVREYLTDPDRLRLIVLDGTWRKSRKMLYLNPLLQRLPRLALSDTGGSNYRIRKAHKPDQLSTLEATCAALTQINGGAEALQPLLAAFDGFVAQQMMYQAAACAPAGDRRFLFKLT